MAENELVLSSDPQKQVKPNEEFSLQISSIGPVHNIGLVENSIADNPVEIEGQRSVTIHFYRNISALYVNNGDDVPTGIESVAPISLLIDLGNLSLDDIARTTCQIGYADKLYPTLVQYDHVEMDQKGETQAWIDPYKLLFPADPEILSRIKFKIDTGK